METTKLTLLEVSRIRVKEIEVSLTCPKCTRTFLRKIRFDEVLFGAGNQCPICLWVFDLTAIAEWVREHADLI